jgi:ankyrin repeat protein
MKELTDGIYENNFSDQEICFRVTEISQSDTQSVIASKFKIKDETEGETEGETEKLLMQIACEKGWLLTIKKLVELGANVNEYEEERGNTPLIIAICSANYNKDLCDFLINNDNIDIELKNSTQNSALHYASFFNREDLVNTLIKKTSDVKIDEKNQKDKTPLYLAIEKDNNEIAKLLIDHGADINASGPEGKTPLDLAIETGNQDIICYYCKHKDEDDNTPLYNACNLQEFELAEKLLYNIPEDQARKLLLMQDKTGISPIYTPLYIMDQTLKKDDPDKFSRILVEFSISEHDYLPPPTIVTVTADTAAEALPLQSNTTAASSSSPPPPVKKVMPSPTPVPESSSLSLLDRIAWHHYSTGIGVESARAELADNAGDINSKLTSLKNDNTPTAEDSVSKKFFNNISKNIPPKDYTEVVKTIDDKEPKAQEEYLGLDPKNADKAQYSKYNITDSVQLKLAIVDNNVYLEQNSILAIKQANLSLCIEVENSGQKEFIEFHEGQLLMLDRAKIGDSKIGGKNAIVGLLESKEYREITRVAPEIAVVKDAETQGVEVVAVPEEVVEKEEGAPPPDADKTKPAAESSPPLATAQTKAAADASPLESHKGNKPHVKTGVTILDELDAKSQEEIFDEYIDITSLTQLIQQDITSQYNKKSAELDQQINNLKDSIQNITEEYNIKPKEDIEKIAEKQSTPLSRMRKGFLNFKEKYIGGDKHLKRASAKTLLAEKENLSTLKTHKTTLESSNKNVLDKLNKVIAFRDADKEMTGKIEWLIRNGRIYYKDVLSFYQQLKSDDKIKLISTKFHIDRRIQILNDAYMLYDLNQKDNPDYSRTTAIDNAIQSSPSTIYAEGAHVEGNNKKITEMSNLFSQLKRSGDTDESVVKASEINKLSKAFQNPSSEAKATTSPPEATNSNSSNKHSI